MRLLPILCAVALYAAAPTGAEALIEAGHWKRARTLVESQLHEAPGDARSNFLMSQIRGAFGDRSTPLPLAEKAVALDGQTAKYHRQVAEVLGVTAQHAGAFQLILLARRFRKELDMALALDPRDPQALRDLMEFYLVAPGIAGGDARRAQEVAGRIAAIDAVEGLLARARIAAFHNQPAARESLLRQSAEARPRSYKARLQLVEFYLEDGRRDQAAETEARAAMELDPARADAYAALAEVQAERGEWDALDATFALAAREVSDDAVPYYRAAARLLAGRRDPARAERYLRVYLAQEPEGNRPAASEAHLKLGLALEALGRGAEAIAEFSESVRLDPGSKAAAALRRARRSGPAAESDPGVHR